MTPEQKELWERIQAYEPDYPQAAFPFSVRLARDNGWSEEFAQRVVAEYRRFAFLAMAAGHPVSPSDAVDQAWHLHLLYTRSYWERFCRETLRRPLHHEPTRGGATERVKFHEWYGRTLESYRRWFDAEPPLDIWPSARQRFGDDIRFVRVNTSRNWIIPKPGWSSWYSEVGKWGREVLHGSAVRLGVAGSVFVLGMVGCGGDSTAWPAELAVDGPTFIGCFVVGWVVVHVAAACLRQLLRLPADDERASQPVLDPYGVAFLSDGAGMALNAAIVNLARAGVIEVRIEDKRLVRQGPLSCDAHPVERGVYEMIADPAGSTLVQLREWASSGLDALKVALKRDGLVVADASAWRAVLWPMLLALLVPVVGFVRLRAGLERDKPVELLVLLTVLSLGVALAGFGRRPFRSRRGDGVLARLRARHARLGEQPRDALASAEPTILPLTIGLYGMGVLAGTPLDEVRQLLEKNDREGGCGGGCGGDGGCGGGCGGCG